MALMKIMEKLSTAVSRKRYCVSVLVDLKKAFDTTDHNITVYCMYITVFSTIILLSHYMTVFFFLSQPLSTRYELIYHPTLSCTTPNS